MEGTEECEKSWRSVGGTERCGGVRRGVESVKDVEECGDHE